MNPRDLVLKMAFRLIPSIVRRSIYRVKFIHRFSPILSTVVNYFFLFIMLTRYRERKEFDRP